MSSSITLQETYANIFPHQIPASSTSFHQDHYIRDEGFTDGTVMRCEIERMHARKRAVVPEWIANFLKIMPPLPHDPHSNARPLEAKVTHLDLEISEIDFEKRTLTGTARYDYKKRVDASETNPKVIVLDIEKGMKITSIFVNGTLLSTAKWTLIETATNKPLALSIPIDEQRKLGDVSISYETSPNATGLFWRPPEMTDNKTHPMLFSQAAPLMGASFFPGQHSPQIHFTSRLTINTGNPELIVIGSMENNPISTNDSGVYRLYMTKPIPAYLMGFAIGRFDYTSYDEKCGVYAEPIKRHLAADRFSKLPLYLAKAEELFGPYLWSVYRPILLPLAYPYGAMEHPCASFIGGDCVDRPAVVPHELAHSWFGNLVTAATWGEIFFNEGLTCFAENLLCKICISEDFANLSAKNRLNATAQALKKFREAGETEKMKLCGKLDDEPASIEIVPYGKGMLFFIMLEKVLNSENMLQFLKDYSNAFAFQSMSKERFLGFLKLWLSHSKITDDFETFMQTHHIEEWLTGTEYPENTPIIESPLLDAVVDAAKTIAEGNDVSDMLDSIGSPLIKEAVFRAILSTLEVQGNISLENIERFYRVHGNRFRDNDFMRGGWVRLFAKRGYLTSESQSYIKKYIIERNSVDVTELIVRNLLVSDEGRALVVQILKEGKKPECLEIAVQKNYLDPLTVKTIEDILAKNSV